MSLPRHHHNHPPSSPLPTTPSPSPSPSCPFCAIAASYPPILPSSFLPGSSASSSSSSSSLSSSSGPQSRSHSQSPSQSQTQAQAHLVLSTRHVLAFLDIMPLTRGHVLVVTRGHWEDLGKVGVGVGMELGKWIPVLSRVVMRVVLGGEEASEEDGDVDVKTQAQVQRQGQKWNWNWNVVQNNGPLAAQQIPHVHFHIVPRPPLTSAGAGAGADADRSTRSMRSWVMFGRGQREELDDEEGEALARAMREELAREVRRVREVEGVDLELEFDQGLDGDGSGGRNMKGAGGSKL